MKHVTELMILANAALLKVILFAGSMRVEEMTHFY